MFQGRDSGTSRGTSRIGDGGGVALTGAARGVSTGSGADPGVGVAAMGEISWTDDSDTGTGVGVARTAEVPDTGDPAAGVASTGSGTGSSPSTTRSTPSASARSVLRGRPRPRRPGRSYR